MPILRQTVRRISALVPDKWKRRLKTGLFEASDTEGSLRRMQRLGFNPAVVIDVGAYIGEWTRGFKRIFPSARILMVERQPGHFDRLRAVVAAFNGVELAPVLCGAQERGSVPFHMCESASSVLMESARPTVVSTISVPIPHSISSPRTQFSRGLISSSSMFRVMSWKSCEEENWRWLPQRRFSWR